MRSTAFLVALAVLGVGCASPADLTEADGRKCAGFGFDPGTNEYARCMMRLSQQRDAQQHERALQQDHDRAVSEQKEKDRQMEQDAADKAAADKRYQDWLDMSGHGSTPPPTPRSDDSEDQAVPSGVAIPGMNCSGEGDDMACDAR